MINRRLWALGVLAGIGIILLLSRNYRIERVTPPVAGQERMEAEIKRQARNLPDEETESSSVPESSRHAAGEIEKHRMARLAALEKAFRDQEEKVEERRKVLASIVRTRGIIYNSKTAMESRNQQERDKIQLESQINSMSKYQGEQLMVYAAGLDFPDNTVKDLYPRYLEARRGLDSLKISGLGAGHPTLQAQVDQVEAVKSQIDEGIAYLKSTAQAKLEMTVNHLNRADAAKLDAQDYVDAKREFETDQKLLQELKLKRITEEMKAKQGGR